MRGLIGLIVGLFGIYIFSTCSDDVKPWGMTITGIGMLIAPNGTDPFLGNLISIVIIVVGLAWGLLKSSK